MTITLECNGEIVLRPCPFCGESVETRWNSMTGEHYISHTDWNSKCPQRPFYGREDQWNERPEVARLQFARDVLAKRVENAEALNEVQTLRFELDRMRGEVIQWIEASNAGTKVILEQQAEIKRLRKLLEATDDKRTP